MVEVLTPHFGDLDDAHTADLLRDVVARHAAAPAPAMELLLDSAGNWRLRAHREPGRVRVACFKVPPQTAPDAAREDELNQLLPGLNA